MAFKQTLIFFENIISSDEPMFNNSFASELNKIGNYAFGKGRFQYLIDFTDKDKQLQEWSGKILNKTVSYGYGESYTFKSAFDIYGEEFSTPLKAWLLEPEGCFQDPVIVFTCENNGTIKNPLYVCGVMMDTNDLKMMLDEL